MVKIFRQSLHIGLFLSLTGCFTVKYTGSFLESADVRFSPQQDNEEFVEDFYQDFSEHHFLFGLISMPRSRDIAQAADLRDGEKLVNLRITRQVAPLDALTTVILGVLTNGLSLIVWVPTTTVIAGDIVQPKKKDKNAAPPEADDEQNAPASEVSEESDTNSAKKGKGQWIETQLYLDHDAAKAHCQKLGARLPTVRDVGHSEQDVPGKGHVWADDREGDEAYYVNVANGAAFLTSKDKTLSVLCVK